MIRYLMVLYMGLVSVLLVDRNPLYSLPLILVLLSFMFENKWVGFAGVSIYIIVTLGNLDTIDLRNMGRLLLHLVLVMAPLVVLLELVLSKKPYRIERISAYPLVISGALVMALLLFLLILTRIRRIGVYLESEPLLQVFIIISLSILIFGPTLLTRTGNKQNNTTGHYNKALKDKNE